MPEATPPGRRDAWLPAVGLPGMDVDDGRHALARVQPANAPSRQRGWEEPKVAAPAEREDDLSQPNRRRGKLHEASPTRPRDDAHVASSPGDPVAVVDHG